VNAGAHEAVDDIVKIAFAVLDDELASMSIDSPETQGHVRPPYFGGDRYVYAERLRNFMDTMKLRTMLQEAPSLIVRSSDWHLWGLRVSLVLGGVLIGVGGMLALKRLTSEVHVRTPARRGLLT
jgi:hypothetical protein